MQAAELSASETADATECFGIIGKGAATIAVRVRGKNACQLCDLPPSPAPPPPHPHTASQSSELGTCLRSLGYAPTEAEVAAMAKDVGGTFDQAAFLKCCAEARTKTPLPADLLEALKAFDKAGTGKIKVAELKKVLTEYTDEKMATEMVEEIVRDGDKWRNGEIDFDYFVRMVSSF
eukprot:SAG22_NODE_18_length_32591_cov_38.043549_23_plen_177_part_00